MKPVQSTVPPGATSTNQGTPSQKPDIGTYPPVDNGNRAESLLTKLMRQSAKTDRDLSNARAPLRLQSDVNSDVKSAFAMIDMIGSINIKPNHYRATQDDNKTDSKRIVVKNAFSKEFVQNLDMKTFDVVTGRFGMSPYQPSYIVTPEEMCRRIQGPERLNSSNLSINLRRSKVTNGGTRLREQLNEHGINLEKSSRQKVYPNRVIGLVEAEVLHLGLDLEATVSEDYPVEDIAEEILTQTANIDATYGTNHMNMFSNMKTFSECMSSMESVFTSVVPPLSGIVPAASRNRILNRALENYSSTTHGLGIVSHRIWVRQMKEIGEKIEKRRQNPKSSENAENTPPK